MRHRDNPLLAAIYATARRHLAKAREAEDLALEAGLSRYFARSQGEKARRLAAAYDAKRSLHLSLALQERRRAGALRLYLRGCEAQRCRHDFTDGDVCSKCDSLRSAS